MALVGILMVAVFSGAAVLTVFGHIKEYGDVFAKALAAGVPTALALAWLLVGVNTLRSASAEEIALLASLVTAGTVLVTEAAASALAETYRSHQRARVLARVLAERSVKFRAERYSSVETPARALCVAVLEPGRSTERAQEAVDKLMVDATTDRQSWSAQLDCLAQKLDHLTSETIDEAHRLSGLSSTPGNLALLQRLGRLSRALADLDGLDNLVRAKRLTTLLPDMRHVWMLHGGADRNESFEIFSLATELRQPADSSLLREIVGEALDDPIRRAEMDEVLWRTADLLPDSCSPTQLAVELIRTSTFWADR